MGNREVEIRQYTKEDAYKTLSNVTGWIHNVDTKTGILMSFIALIIGLNGTVIEGLKYLKSVNDVNALDVFVGIFIFAYVIMAIVTIIMCLCTIFASTSVDKLKKEQNIKISSLIFYGDINKISYNDFINKTSVQPNEDIIKDLETQIYINSHIADRKYKFFNKALICALVFFMVAVILIVLVGLI